MTRVARRMGGVLVVVVAACGGGDATSPEGSTPVQGAAALTPAAVTVVSGGNQSGDPGAALGSPLVVLVTTASGEPVPGVTVGFTVSSGSASVTTASAVTDASGRAQTQLTLGSVAGPVRVTAAVQGTALTTSFTATVAATATACTAAGTTTLAAGQVLTPAGTTLCIAGGAAGAEYALVPFNTATASRARSAFVVRPTGIDPVASARLLPTTNTAAAADVAALVAARAAAEPTDERRAFEARLRATAARALVPRFAAARAWAASRGATPGLRRARIPRNVTVGQLVTLNANGDNPCGQPALRVSRVEAVSNRAIVVADTLNPSGGFTAAEYASIAATFDTLVYPVNVRNFGEPTDLDGNGRVILYYTSAVNALTPKNSSSFVGGFFTPRDLFPTQDTPTLGEGCAGSNVAEMFYLLVPDPGGMVNGNRFSKAFVAGVTVGTVAHEFEHLINSSRRVYVNTQADDFEETWLDEGLAHVAEELLFYARTGLAPRQNLDATRLRSTPAISAAFSDAGIDNFDRLSGFLDAPTRHSPYADDDSLATRGATWSFLRYAADQQGATAQEAIWQRLVDSPTTGMSTLQRVFGSNLTPLFRDWATMLLVDDVPGADARYQMPSWNLRSVLAALDGSGAYPLQTMTLTNGVSTTASIVGGGAAYVRFAVGAGKTASVAWEALPPTVTLSLVRLR